MGYPHIARHQSFRRQVVLNAVFAPFSPNPRVFNTPEPNPESAKSQNKIGIGDAYGAAASEMTPVFKATIPNCSNSDTRVARLRSLVKM